jgi:membrane protease YdiL (CAAX protease family)
MTKLPDFPFYSDRPVLLSGRHWLILMAALAIAFAALTLLPLQAFPQSLIPALLFLCIPLLALRWVAGPHWTALFRRVGLRQIGQMLLFGLLTLAGSMAVALILSQFVSFSDNPVSVTMGEMTTSDLIARLTPTIPQLIGEELFGILPFLAVLWLCVTRLGLSRWVGVCAALIVSALIFGAAHLPTYDWNWAQALIGIGSARVLLTLAYIATRNLWVSSGAHILNDWSGFLFAFAVGHAPMGSES